MTAAVEQQLPTSNEVSDASLLRRVRQGSEEAATQVYLRYVHRLRGLARAHSSADLARHVDAEEMVQSIFGSFFRGARRGHYEVPAGEELWRLLVVMALNKIRSKGTYYRAAKRDMRRTTDQDPCDALADLPADHDTAALAFLQLTVSEAVERLPPQHRQIVRLRMDGHDVAAIAAQSGRSRRTVERLLQEARQDLAYLLQEDDDGRESGSQVPG